MGELLKSWLFFTALLLFLVTAAVTLPELGAQLFGQTESRLETAVDDLEAQAQEVWAGLSP